MKQMMIVLSMILMCHGVVRASEKTGGGSVDLTLQKDFSIMESQLNIPTNWDVALPSIPFFEKMSHRKCGDFLVDGNRLPHMNGGWSIKISCNGQFICDGIIIETSSFHNARREAIIMSMQTSMMIEIFVQGLILQTDIGDFCIINEGTNGKKRQWLRFVRGSTMIALNRHAQWKGDLRQIAKAIDAAMLEDAKKAKSAESPKPTSQSTSSPPSPAQVQGKRK